MLTNKISLKIPIIVFVGIFFLLSCENDPKAIEQITKKNNYPVRRGKDVVVIYSEKAYPKVQLKAKEIEEYDGENPLIFMKNGVQVFFYDSAKHINAQLKAEKIIHKVNDQLMVASGNVEVINEKKEQLNTEKLYWNQKEGKIYSNDFVKITTQEEILMGEGFESNEDFTKYSIKKLKGTININENDSIQQGN
ncbi:MAG: hypothetical protein Kow0079_11670 [Vicingaceae bacterium]